MRVSSADDVARLVALRCEPERVAHVRALVADAGILLRGHFQLHSGVHAEYFVRVRGLAREADLLDDVARELLALVPAHGADAIVCPETAGFAIGEAVARLAQVPVAVVKTDINRRPTTELRTGAIELGSRVMIVNDVATSGSSLRLLHRAATAHGAIVQRALTVAAIGNGGLKATNDLGVRGSWLMESLWPLWPAATCELCTRGIPLILAGELD